MSIRHRQNKKGFTLLEIVFALAILVIGIVGVLAIFPVGLRAGKRSGDFTRAAILAQRQMENIKRARDIYTNSWAAGPQFWPNTYPPAEKFADNPDYSWKAIISEVGVTNLRQVSLSVYWLDRGAEREENFTTYLADYN